jgi:membrane associated rhomboid family serine protease
MPSIRLTPAVKAILIICFGAFVVQQTGDNWFGTHFVEWFGLVPTGFLSGRHFWQLITYAFLHADVMHLFFNLMMFAFIGWELESVWGTPRFLRFFFFCSISAGLFYLFLWVFIVRGDLPDAPMIGASGAIYGLLAAYGLIFGDRVLLFMMLFPMKAKHFVWVLGLIEFMTTVFSGRGGLASAAHLGGMIAGLGYLWVRASYVVLKQRKGESSATRRVKKRKVAKHLKLVVNREKGRDDDDVDGKPRTWH